jgi:hypothetical protein
VKLVKRKCPDCGRMVGVNKKTDVVEKHRERKGQKGGAAVCNRSYGLLTPAMVGHDS